MSKSFKIIVYILYIVSVIIGLGFYFFNGSANKMVSPILTWSFILCIVAVIVSVIMPLFFRKGGNKGKKSLMELGIFVLLCLFAFLIANGNPIDAHVAVPATHGTCKMVDSVLKLSIILLIVAFCCAVFGGIVNSLKKR